MGSLIATTDSETVQLIIQNRNILNLLNMLKMPYYAAINISKKVKYLKKKKFTNKLGSNSSSLICLQIYVVFTIIYECYYHFDFDFKCHREIHLFKYVF